MTDARDIDLFCRAVEARSQEHCETMDVAIMRGWWAIAGSVLRIELDSMIRVVYLLRRPDRRNSILASCVAGKGFRYDGRLIADRRMVTLATAENGWVETVYTFGNNFVHLTDAHNYAQVDPFLIYSERDAVIRYLDQYHGGAVPGPPLDSDSTIADVAAYAPHVLRKIASNLRGYLEQLRTDPNQIT